MSGKNDDYAGNFLQRIQFNIEKLNDSFIKLGIKDVEIVVVDWASEKRLSEVLKTDNFKFTKFVYVSEDIASRVSPDSGFSSVHALNSGYRRSIGKYVFFVDGDSYLSFETTEKLYSLCKELDIENKKAYYWASRYHLPYEIHSNSNSIKNLDEFIDKWILENKIGWNHDKIDTNNVMAPMGLMLSRDIADHSTCYYEKLNKWGFIEIELSSRLKREYKCDGDLEDLGMYFFHLDHHTIGSQGKSKKTNAGVFGVRNINANKDDWGLINENLEIYKVN